jgi:hypothetical protein
MGTTYIDRRFPHNAHVGIARLGVDAGVGRAYKRGPSWGDPGWGMLFEIVER